jgi:hypothetical protein
VLDSEGTAPRQSAGLGSHPDSGEDPGFVTQGQNDYYSLQPWAIVDPDPQPGAVQFENYLLPIAPAVVSGGVPSSAPNLFCAGHAWTQYGDLVVVGGTTYALPASLLGATLTYAFSPSEASAPFPTPGATQSLYAGGTGHWAPGPDLQFSRWYPTAMLTSRLARVQSIYPNEGEVVLVAGGSLQFSSPGPDDTWNSYEALRITGPSAFLSSGLEADSVGAPPNQVFTWDGPGTVTPAPLVEVDWLHEYPRLHQLSNGRVFFSGYAPHGAMLDHETPGTWYKSPPQPDAASDPKYSSNWHAIRHDGSSVLLPSVNGVSDVVMRIGGANGSPGPGVNTTATTEVSVGGGYWTATPSLPVTSGAPDGGRMFGNVLPLPTGALLMVGGLNVQGGAPTSMLAPLIYADGAWFADAPNPFFATRRNYHSAAVLLADGRVLIGGGDDRQTDYEIYSPYYLQLPTSHRPTNVMFQAPAPPTDPDTGALRLTYNSTYGMICSIAEDGVRVARVALMAPGAMTHHSDMHARHVPLKIAVQSQTSFTFSTPANDRLAPRGIYMLWVITTSGAVSDATWVVLR